MEKSQKNNYPLSEEEFKRLRNLPQKEMNKLPLELLEKFHRMIYMKRQEKGYLDWE